MTLKHTTTALLLAVTGIGAQAASTLTLSNSSIAISVSTPGAFRPLSTAGGTFTVQVQDQLGLDASGAPLWGTLLSNTTAYSPAGASITSPLGASAVITSLPGNQSLTVSTPNGGGYARAEQDIVVQFSLAAHATVTFAWDSVLSGSYSGPTAGTFDLLGQVSLGTTAETYPFSYPFANADHAGSAFTGSPTHRSISFTNTSDLAVNTTYHSKLQLSTKEVGVGAVPEPESAALLAAGLAVTGLLLRRRRA